MVLQGHLEYCGGEIMEHHGLMKVMVLALLIVLQCLSDEIVAPCPHQKVPRFLKMSDASQAMFASNLTSLLQEVGGAFESLTAE